MNSFCLLIGIILRWGFLIWELIFIYCRLFVLIFVIFLCCFFLHYVSAKFHLWPSSGDLPWPRIGMMSLVTVSPVITAFHSCCLLHHVFDQVNLWPAWVGFESAIFWQCSPGTIETQRLYLLRHGPRRAIKDGFFGLIILIWSSIITGDMVTRLIIPIRGHGKSPEEGQRWNLAET